MPSDPEPGEIHAIVPGENLLAATSRAYGVKAGTAARLRLAQKINAHPWNRRFWRAPGNAFERENFPDGIVSFGPDFTRDDPQRRALKGESRSFARIFIPPREELVHTRLGPAVALPRGTAPQEQADPDPCDLLDDAGGFTLKPTDIVIVGPDDRRPVANTLAIPHRWICTILTCVAGPDGRTWRVTGMGTGVRIGPSHVLTAAHVLYDLAEMKQGEAVVQVAVPTTSAGLGFGRNGPLVLPGPPNVPAPPVLTSYGLCLATGAGSFWVPPEWKKGVDEGKTVETHWEMCAHDYGLIRFDPQNRCSRVGAVAGAPHHWGDAHSSTAFSNKDAFWDALQQRQILDTAGYPGDKKCTPWETSGKLTEFGSLPGGRTDGQPNYAWLMLNYDSAKGMSGSPVWRRVKGARTDPRSDPPETLVLTGILSATSNSTPGQMYAAGLTPFAWKRLREQMALKPG